MYPDVLKLSPRMYEKHAGKTVLDTTLIKRLRDIFLMLRMILEMGSSIKLYMGKGFVLFEELQKLNPSSILHNLSPIQKACVQISLLTKTELYAGLDTSR
jgi:hypothetical protein